MQEAIGMGAKFGFTLAATDGAARTGVISTPRGEIRTPAFMPVGTAGDGQGDAAGKRARDRGRYPVGQHLSSDAAAHGRADRALWAGCTGS